MHDDMLETLSLVEFRFNNHLEIGTNTEQVNRRTALNFRKTKLNLGEAL